MTTQTAGIRTNHNQTAQALVVKTGVKGGALTNNHNQTVAVRARSSR
jgi:hypothetical protein